MVEAPAQPEPPEPPSDNECCGNGCDPCVWTVYQTAMNDYRQALARWQQRYPAGPENNDV